ncbi:MAG: helix-turn-helix domain-containing protein [Planctomycetaceae bacterium]
MQRKLSPQQVAQRFGVSRTTVIQWCESGQMPAVNVASPTASRRRWRMSEDDIETFEARRANAQTKTTGTA